MKKTDKPDIGEMMREILEKLGKVAGKNYYIKEGYDEEKIKELDNRVPVWAGEKLGTLEQTYQGRLENLREELQTQINMEKIEQEQAVEVFKNAAQKMQKEMLQ